MIVVYTPRVNDRLARIKTSEKYDCEADRNYKEKKRNQINKLIEEINRRNEENNKLKI